MTRIVVCLDGFDPVYLDVVDTPAWDAIAAEGASGICECVVPSLTNVNNMGILTSSFPETHGITGNSYFDRETNERVYMESPAYLRTETRLEQAAADGKRVAALVVKKKLRRMVGHGIDFVASAEEPPVELERAVGTAPDIYSGTASVWLFRAAEHVLDTHDPDLLYISTTDVVPHKHAPGSPEADRWVRALDDGLGRLYERDGVDLIATADHGMREKTLRVDLTALLRAERHDAEVIRLIRDKHTYHHQNLGGVAFIYLRDARADAVAWLADIEGVERVLTAAEAAERFRLPMDRIGDLLVLGTPESVFGPVDGSETSDTVSLRSHGSHHERRVPYVATVDCDLSDNVEAFDVF